MEVIGDVGNTFWQLFESDIATTNRSFDHIYKLKEQYTKTIAANTKEHYQSEEMMPARLVEELRSVMGEDDILALDNGLYKVWFARNYLAYHANTLLLDNALATMGAGYASALAAKMVHPTKNVVAVTGDGGFMMNLGDIETVVTSGLDLTIIILNDNAYGMIKWKQSHH